MLLGLLFNIPGHNDTKGGNSEFTTPSGRETLEVILVVIVVVSFVVAPLRS
jgi:hypothetical protein